MQMYQLILIFACSLLCGNTGILHECRVTLSDALPIQFWSTNCDTFNEKEVDGVFSKCFCQPFNCDDEIVLQLKSTSGVAYKLNIFSDTGEFIEQKSFSESGNSGVYYLVFTLVNYCDQVVSFVLVDGNAAQTSYLSSTNSSYSGWSNASIDIRKWLIAPYEFGSKRLQSDNLPVFIPDDLSINVDLNVVSGALQNVGILLYTATGATQSVSVGDIGTGITSVPITTLADFTKISVYASANDTNQQGKLTEVSIDGSDYAGTVHINDTSFASGWTQGTNPFVVKWTFGGGQAISGTVGPIPDDETDFASKDLSMKIPKGAEIDGSITYNIDVGLSGQLIVRIFTENDATNETLWFSDELIGTGLDVTFPIPSYTTVEQLNSKVKFGFVRTAGTGVVRIKDIEITGISASFTITNGNFSSGLTNWTQLPDPDGINVYSWTHEVVGGTNGAAVLTVPSPKLGVDFLGSPETSATIQKNVAIPAGEIITYQLQVQASTDEVAALQIDFTVLFKNNAGTVLHTISDSVNNETAKTITDIIGTSDAITSVTFSASNVGLAELVAFNVISFTISGYQELAKSDCISVKEDHDETVLITYSNNRPFASLNSSVGTPDHAFNLRIPAVFFKERFPEESEVIDLSNSRSIQLNAQVKAQRLLNVGPMPFYMHRKAKLALTFQTVTIDDQDWVKEEAYEVSETKRTHPLSKAQCWLTEKDTIYRNVL